MSLQSELKSLFPPNIIRQSKGLEPEHVDALAVSKAARALMRLKGKPVEQVALVQTMRPDTAAALCRWLIDPAFCGLVGNITRH